MAVHLRAHLKSDSPFLTATGAIYQDKNLKVTHVDTRSSMPSLFMLPKGKYTYNFTIAFDAGDFTVNIFDLDADDELGTLSKTAEPGKAYKLPFEVK